MIEPTLPLEDLALSLIPGLGRLWLNLEALRGSHSLIQGTTGAGKSHLVRFLCEQTFGQMQQLIFDLEGEYVTLTERFDYALFSDGAKIRPDPDTAPILVRRLLEMGTSAVFDLSELSSAEQQRLVAAAAAELVRAPQGIPRSVLVVLDEVQRLAPQAGQGDAASTQAIRDLANRGRKRGISLLLATQRHSSVDAGLRGVMANTIVGGTPPGLDMESAGKKLGFNAQQQRRLASLRHEFFFLGPAFGDSEGERLVQLAKSGPVQTHHLDAGEAGAYTPPPASEAVAALYAQLGDIPAEAEAEAQDLEALQSHNRTLRTRIADLEAENTRLQGLKTEVARLPATPLLVEAGRSPRSGPPRGRKPLDAAVPLVPAAVPAPPQTALPASLVLLDPSAAEPSKDGKLGRPAEPLSDEMLLAAPVDDKPRLANNKSEKPGAVNVDLRLLEQLLSEFHPFALTLPQLGVLTRMDLSGASGQNAVRALRRAGLAAWTGERLTATEKGRRTQVRLMDAQTYRKRWGQVLGKTTLRLLLVLAEAGPGGLTWKEWLDQAALILNGALSSAKARLLEIGFAQQDGNHYRLGDWPQGEAEGSQSATTDPAPYLRLESA